MKIPVVLASDERIVSSVGVVLTSMAVNAAEGTCYDVHFFAAGDVTQASRDRLAEIARRHPSHVTVTCHALGDVFSSVRRTHAYVNHVAAFRMLIAEILPQYEKVLYVDTDIIVRADLAELFATDLGDDYIGGVVNMHNQIALHDKICRQADMTDLSTYVNSGVLLMNLTAIRRDGIAEKWQALLGKYEGSVDQHIINHVCAGHVSLLPLKYNVCLSNLHLYRNGGAVIFASPGEVRQAYEDPVIFHFTLKTKPWDYYDLPFAHEWYRYYLKSAFSDLPCPRRALYPHDGEPARENAVRRCGLDRLLYKLWKHLGKRYAKS